MKRLDKYVATQVLSSIAIVLLVIVGLDLVFDFIDEVADLNERYNMEVILQYLLYRIPGRFYEYLPLSSLIGCLIGLGLLASHSELTVMRAAGVSTLRIVASVLKPAVLLAFLAMAVGEFAVPVTEQLAQSTKALAKSGGRALRSQNGVWHREDNTFIHINAVIPGGRIEGVTRFEFDENGEMRSSSFAQRGHYGEGYWELENVKKTVFSAQSTSKQLLEREQWRLGLTPDLLSVVVVKPQDLSMSGLW
ncbi:MAG: LPS export ABC transporter permease LptG, partial [Pseudomonadales bacterium]